MCCILALSGLSCKTERINPVNCLPANAAVRFTLPAWEQLRAWTTSWNLNSLREDVETIDTLLRSLRIDPAQLPATTAGYLYNAGPKGVRMGLALELNDRAEWPAKTSASYFPSNRYQGYTIHQHRLPSGRSVFSVKLGSVVLVGSVPLCLEEMLDQVEGDRQNGFFQKSESFPLLTNKEFRFQIIVQELPVLLAGHLTKAGRWQLSRLADQINRADIIVDPREFSYFVRGQVLPVRERLSPPQVLKRWQSLVPKTARHWRQSPFDTYTPPLVKGAIAEPALELYDALGMHLVLYPLKDAASSRTILERLEEYVLLQKTDYLNSELYQFNDPELDQALFGDQPEAGPIWATLFDQTLLLASQRAALENWLDAHLLEAALTEDPAFLNWYDTLLTNQVPIGLSYFQPGMLEQLIDRWFVDWEPRIPFGKQLHWITPAEDRLYRWTGEMLLKQMPSGVLNAGIEWRQELNSPPRSLHAVVGIGEQPSNTQIGIQDSTGRLTLLDAEGNTLLRIRLNGAVQGSLYLDRGSGKPGYLCFTQDAVYRFDGKGRPINGFPRTLPAPLATAPTAIDFNRDGRLQFFLPLQNGRVIGLTSSGNALPDWNPGVEAGVLQCPINHLQTADADYLAALDTSHRLSVFARNGSRRWEVDFPEIAFLPYMGTQTVPGQERIALAQVDGRLRIVNLQGAHFPLRVESADRFLTTDLSGDERIEYLLSKGTTISCYGYSAGDVFGRLWAVQMPLTVDALLAPPGAPFLLALNRERSLVYLVDARGVPLPIDPIAADVPPVFSTTNDGRLLLISLIGQSVYGFRLPALKSGEG